MNFIKKYRVARKSDKWLKSRLEYLTDKGMFK